METPFAALRVPQAHLRNDKQVTQIVLMLLQQLERTSRRLERYFGFERTPDMFRNPGFLQRSQNIVSDRKQTIPVRQQCFIIFLMATGNSAR